MEQPAAGTDLLKNSDKVCGKGERESQCFRSNEGLQMLTVSLSTNAARPAEYLQYFLFKFKIYNICISFDFHVYTLFDQNCFRVTSRVVTEFQTMMSDAGRPAENHEVTSPPIPGNDSQSLGQTTVHKPKPTQILAQLTSITIQQLISTHPTL